MSEYAPDEPATIAVDPGIQRQPYEPAAESADPFVGKDGLADAASEVSRGRETKETLRRFVRDPDEPSAPAPSDVTITPATAAASLAHNRNLEAQSEQAELDRVTAAAVDDLRGEQPTEQQPIQPDFQLQAEAPPAEPTVLDEMLAELPEHRRQPFVAAFMQHMDSAAHQARTGYDQAVAQAQAVTQQNEQAAAHAMLQGEALLLSHAPELAQYPREQRPLALDILEKQNPARAAQIRAVDRQIGMHLQNESYKLRAAQQRQVEAQQYQQQQAAVSFQRYGAAEDAKVDKLLAAETSEHRFAIQQEAAAILREDGMTDQQIQHMWHNDATFRSATAQKMLMREAKSRIAERGVRAARVAPVQAVQRPGVGEPASDRSEFADVSREMRGRDLSVKDATRLILARRSSR